ncbi:TIGR03618 family F420-dependent PPOX class oxidoreductase [Streptomyces sp. SBC-4]|nr:TIGR03618 family F420-dependent PPOX class oxidoreductase [Streptomyces sp. SBC-4]MDV5145445.1 TIGR03618 family F420-dependent PPOX class oxidoreductase [Streptomyces sp. SBC-4]
MATEIAAHGAEYVDFWNERHLCTLTTLQGDGRPHVVPVGVTLDAERGMARIITRKSSRKIANILGAASGEARVAVCQVDGGRWATLEGAARVRTEPDVVCDAVARYAVRYGRTPNPDPERVVIEITVDRAMGQAKKLAGPPARAAA